MNRSEAKREAYLIAAAIIFSDLDAGICYDEDDLGEKDMEKIRRALREIASELMRRGKRQRKGEVGFA